MAQANINLALLLRDAQNASPDLCEFLKEFSRVLSATVSEPYYETIVEATLNPSIEMQQIVREYGLHLIEGCSGQFYLSWAKGVED